MITASAAAKGPVISPGHLILDQTSHQHNFVSAQDIRYEKQSHRWNKG